MTTQNGRAFNEWLRAQLKAKKMSQRQLAQQSGVDHSTISRLIRGDRMPSLGTATKLARGLRELRDDADTPQYLGLVTSGSTNPTARVEYALRADELLTEAQVRQIMEYYLAVRMRRYGRSFAEGSSTGRRRRPDTRSPDGRLARRDRCRQSTDERRRYGLDGPIRRQRDRGQHRPHGDPFERPGAGPLLDQFPGHDPDRPPPSGSRGQRTPASGAPAFAIPCVACHPAAGAVDRARSPANRGLAKLMPMRLPTSGEPEVPVRGGRFVPGMPRPTRPRVAGASRSSVGTPSVNVAVCPHSVP